LLPKLRRRLCELSLAAINPSQLAERLQPRDYRLVRSLGISDLDLIGGAYESQGAFVQAEPYYLRVLDVDRTLRGAEGTNLESEVMRVANLYNRYGSF
jgi:hypothetical protein